MCEELHKDSRKYRTIDTGTIQAIVRQTPAIESRRIPERRKSIPAPGPEDRPGQSKKIAPVAEGPCKVTKVDSEAKAVVT